MLLFPTQCSTDAEYHQDIIKKLRFDLPAGLEQNPVDYNKVVSEAQEALTQQRSQFKKLVSLHLPLSTHLRNSPP
jgi:hypothetical protein